ncbi:hypothetical protein HK104_007826 [Borealophlyctis nickersoniae]|nr:hypothetical protein HK104_007826 [Borealophlyctis nickersoniae]
MLLCVANVLLLTAWKSEASCMIEVWMGNLGFELFFGALLVKSYRLHRIFNQSTLVQGLAIPNKLLLKYLALPIVLDVLLLTVWTANPAWRIPVSGSRDCAYLHSRPQVAFMVLLSLIKVCLVAICVYVTVKIRNIPSIFNESRFIGFAIYNNIIVGVLVAIPVATLNDASSTVICLSVGISALVVFTTGLMFVPKIKELLWASQGADGGIKLDPALKKTGAFDVPTTEKSDGGAGLEEAIRHNTQVAKDLEKRLAETKNLLKHLKAEAALHMQERDFRKDVLKAP